MATAAYLAGRKRYQRPQAILWSNNAGTLSSGLYVPTGYEVGADPGVGTSPNILDQFLVLSDHNRSDMNFIPQRIEQRQRTINGRMRSHHIADKLGMSVSWNLLPSRSHNLNPLFDTVGVSDKTRGDLSLLEYTADGGAGGGDLLDWYNDHTGSFWMYLAYDKYNNFAKDAESSEYGHLGQYNQIIEVFFSDFNYSVVKRGGSNHDLWNISVSLEEA